MNSQICECEGIVLRNLRYGETSRVVTIFTRELGKIGAMAKGSRVPRSAFGASLEILTHASYVLYFRPGRDLQFLKSGSVEREFPELLRQPVRYLYASALIEFLDRMLLEEEPAEDLFLLARRGLDVIEKSDRAALPEVIRAFQLRAAALLGYAPLLDRCLRCGRPLPEPEIPGTLGVTEVGASSPSRSEEPWCFRPSEGGVLCPVCASGDEEGIRLVPRALRRVQAMARGRSRPQESEATSGAEASTGGGWVREGPTPAAGGWIRALDRLVEDFLRYHVERYRGLRSLEGRVLWEDALSRARYRASYGSNGSSGS